ncbi:hypothetical protein DFH06DRAFT_1135927 [Mycena polygramma]|nr:hypothetical protein DFH06DRAFT_1135927 [Mycena polygramma]
MVVQLAPRWRQSSTGSNEPTAGHRQPVTKYKCEKNCAGIQGHAVADSLKADWIEPECKRVGVGQEKGDKRQGSEGTITVMVTAAINPSEFVQDLPIVDISGSPLDVYPATKKTSPIRVAEVKFATESVAQADLLPPLLLAILKTAI